MDLKKNIFDNIKECEIKIGYREEEMNLYYPEAVVLELLPSDKEHLSENMKLFCEAVRAELGSIRIEETKEKGRYCVHVPAEGVRYIHKNIKETPFLKSFLREIFEPGKSVEDIIKLFREFSEEVEIEQIDEKEWGISFKDPKIDPYVYYLEQDVFGLQYHRFTKQAYEALKKERDS